MSSPTKTITLAAIIVVAALAGINLVGEAEAADGVSAVSYSDGAYTTSQVLDGDATSVVIADISDYASMTEEGFLYWQSASGTPYYPGATIAIAAIPAGDVVGGVLALTAVYAPTTVDFVVDGEVVASYAPGSVEVPEDPVKEGYAFEGWELDGVTYTADALADIIGDLEAGDALTAVFAAVHTVSWVVDGVTIATGDTLDPAMPQDPTKDHYTFIGWSVDGEVIDPSEYAYEGDTVFVAVFEADILTVTFTVDGEVVATVLVSYGECVVMPALPDGYTAWDWDFATAITEDVTVSAIAAEEAPDTGIYQVQFVADGAVIATYRSDAITVPADPVKDGYDFVGWYIGSELIADPASYAYAQDTVLTAGYRAVDLVYWTVTYMHGDEVVATVDVLDGSTVEGAPEAPEGTFWDYDASVPVSADMTVYAQPETVTVTFWVGGTVVGILTQTVAYGGTVDASAVSEYNLPSGYDGWDWDFANPVYADTAIHATAVVAVEEPGWLDDAAHQLILVVVLGIIIGVLAYVLWLRSQGRLGKGSEDNADATAVAVSAPSASSAKAASVRTETGTVTETPKAETVQKGAVREEAPVKKE